MGTSIQMIDKYYSHLQPMMIAEKLAGKRPEKKPRKPSANAGKTKNPAVS
jgi:hypothetical protein